MVVLHSSWQHSFCVSPQRTRGNQSFSSKMMSIHDVNTLLETMFRQPCCGCQLQLKNRQHTKSLNIVKLSIFLQSPRAAFHGAMVCNNKHGFHGSSLCLMLVLPQKLTAKKQKLSIQQSKSK
jgi:hypothetical protein